ncbi:ImmA/IrrE family metallo-endopeptidase [Rhizobium leguminosarum bv. viciae]|nr:ImmA/IrrE family metallo-endopeptidase [Rhizobium leguminosarum bv. viciae]TCA92861.1 ImmA/IrrE family metallo-endopeptidase [Rhizobium leguminosarum bv. viciae]
MKMPTTWDGWASRVSRYVKDGKELLGLPRFPVRVDEIALHYSRSVFPDTPISRIEGQDFNGKFEGALVPREDGDWAIFYDRGHTSRGRINFTLAHEFGHYLAHRHLSGEPFFCSRKQMWEWDSGYAKMEAEANNFAAFLLMPPDDFRNQTQDFRKPVLSDFEPLRDRYEVSLTAAVLNWLKSTRSRAMVVVSRDGFIDWSWGSQPLLSSGVFFKPRKVTTPVPEESLAALGPDGGASEATHRPGVWSDDEPVIESVVFSEYHEMVISLLVYPAARGSRVGDFDET